MSGKKVELFENPALFRWPPWPRHLNVVTSMCFSSKNGNFCKKIQKNPLHNLHIIFVVVVVVVVQKFTKKEKTLKAIDMSQCINIPWKKELVELHYLRFVSIFIYLHKCRAQFEAWPKSLAHVQAQEKPEGLLSHWSWASQDPAHVGSMAHKFEWCSDPMPWLEAICLSTAAICGKIQQQLFISFFLYFFNARLTKLQRVPRHNKAQWFANPNVQTL